ncbi:MAG: hypothetical protein K0Q74_733, partial [Gammaproteobacteria bacterium]|nr:hypothetical protein [Gammaproteobacteria bacterium]
YINVKERERNKLEEERLLAKAEQEGTPFKKRGALPPLINISLWENSLPDILPPKQQSQPSARDSNS